MLSRLLESEARWLRVLLILGTLTVGIVLAQLVAGYLNQFSDVLLMLILAWLFAFILSPVVTITQRLVPRTPRVIAVVLVYAILFVALSAVVLLVTVQLANSVSGFINDATLQDRAQSLLNDWQATLAGLGVNLDLHKAADEALSGIGAFGKPIADLALASLGVIGNLLLVVFLSLFIVLDKDSILGFINRTVPPRYSDELHLLETSVSSAFGGFMRGQAIQGLVFAAFAAVGSIVLGLDYWPFTTVMVALLQMIPFFGPFFSWAPPVVVAALTPNGPVLLIFLIMAVGWFITMNIVQPRVMAHTVGIHPVMVLVSVLIGLKVYGVFGAIFAIPVAAVVSNFFFYYLNRSSAGGPRDVASRAARRIQEREGRPVRVPTAPGLPASPSEPARPRRRPSVLGSVEATEASDEAGPAEAPA